MLADERFLNLAYPVSIDRLLAANPAFARLFAGVMDVMRGVLEFRGGWGCRRLFRWRRSSEYLHGTQQKRSTHYPEFMLHIHAQSFAVKPHFGVYP